LKSLNSAQRVAASNGFVSISAYDDDPSVGASTIEKMSKEDFTLGADGRPVGLEGPHVGIYEREAILSQGESGFEPHATNPFSLPTPDADGNFVYPNEQRAPDQLAERDENGDIKLNAEGLKILIPRSDHLGQTTAFEAANTVHDAFVKWMGRPLTWGENGQLPIMPHEFVGMNAFYSPQSRGLHFGVVPYRPEGGELKLFEVASSWEVVAHEAGHAMHHALKPNISGRDQGFGQWGEAFGDLLAIFTSTQDADRVQALLEATGGSLKGTNALSKMAEGFSQFMGGTTASLRDAMNTLRVQDTSPQVHSRSQVLTGACFSVFLSLVEKLEARMPTAEAIDKAGHRLGMISLRATDYTPENRVTLEDVAKGLLTADAELLGGSLHDDLVAEFERRQIFTAGSAADWKAQRDAMPALTLPEAASEDDLQTFLNAHAAELGAPAPFGLALQHVQTDDLGQRIVRVELTQDGELLNNHGVLVFRPDGTLGSLQAPMPQQTTAAEATAALEAARAAKLDQHGAKLGLYRDAKGVLTAIAERDMMEGQDPHLVVYDAKNPTGRREEYVFVERQRDNTEWLKQLLPPNAEILSPFDAPYEWLG
jgi:hypothetical protein